MFQRFVLTAVALLSLAAPTQAQLPRTAPGLWVGAPAEEYVRLLQLTGVMPVSSLMIRPTDYELRWTAPDTAPWRAPWSRRYNDAALAPDTIGRIRSWLFSPYSHVTYNSAFAYGMNDGALWSGRGVSAAQTLGWRGELGPLRLDVAPTYTWSENRPFELAPHRILEPNTTPIADQYAGLGFDRPQRFGEKPVRRFDPGQSAISLQGRGFRAGFSARNMWWGPGVENSLIITNNAAGFNHAFVGTQRPLRNRLGTFEALWVVGSLQESGFWRTEADTFPSRRWLTGLTLVYEPRGLEGMSFGFTRLFYTYADWNPMSFSEIAGIMLQTFRKNELVDSVTNPSGDDTRDQMVAVSFRWVFPQVGSEVYGQWGRNDHSTDWRDFFVQPDHSRGWILGAARVFPLRSGVLAVRVEATDLANTNTYLSRASNTWYAHHLIQQGFTQRGQVIGAGIGPGSNQQTLSIDWFHPRGRLGFVGQRQLHNIDGFYRSSRRDPYEQNASLVAGPRTTLFLGPVELYAQYSMVYEFNRHAIKLNDARNHRLDLRLQSSLSR